MTRPLFPLLLLAVAACGTTPDPVAPISHETPAPVAPDPAPPLAEPVDSDGPGEGASARGVPPGINTADPVGVPPGIQCGPAQFTTGTACFDDAAKACQSLGCQAGCNYLETGPTQVSCTK